MAATRPARRPVQYASFDEVLADAERLVVAQAATTGNWSLDQILGHVAVAMEKSVDGMPTGLPWYLRLLGRYFFKPWVLKHGMRPGFKLPAEAEQWAVPAPGGDASAALERLRNAIVRLRTEQTRSPHPVFGPLSAGEWDRVHLRHAELHMSFISEPQVAN
jgi:hypothetical protein